jgi:hypothetical protein
MESSFDFLNIICASVVVGIEVVVVVDVEIDDDVGPDASDIDCVEHGVVVDVDVVTLANCCVVGLFIFGDDCEVLVILSELVIVEDIGRSVLLYSNAVVLYSNPVNVSFSNPVNVSFSNPVNVSFSNPVNVSFFPRDPTSADLDFLCVFSCL